MFWFLVGAAAGILFAVLLCGFTLTITITEIADDEPRRKGETYDHEMSAESLRYLNKRNQKAAMDEYEAFRAKLIEDHSNAQRRTGDGQ